MKHALLLTVIIILVLSFSLQAQVPSKLSYQGLMTNSSGVPVTDGSYTLKFDLYNLSTGGTLRHTETQTSVAVERGTFSVILNPPASIFSESLWVEVTALAGPSISAPMTFAPRAELTSAPYAFRADTANYVLNVPPSQWTTSGSDISYNSGNVGIGTSSPEQKLSVQGWFSLRPTTWSEPTGRGLFMYHNGTSGNIYAFNYQNIEADVLGIGGKKLEFITYDQPPYAGQTRMIVDSSGNVGIGTTDPLTYRLFVSGSTDLAAMRASNDGGRNLSFKYDDTNNFFRMTSDADNGFSYTSDNPLFYIEKTGANPRTYRLSVEGASPRFNISDMSAGVDRLVITSSGNVGIGTSTPSSLLNVKGNGTTSPALRLQHTSNASLGVQLGTSTTTSNDAEFWNFENGFLRFATNDVERLRISAGGNIGIGTTTPDVNAKLDVNGYAFAKAPVVVYDSAAGSGQNFNITWHNNVRVDNNIVEKQANNYEFMLKKSGWYRVSYFILFNNENTNNKYEVDVYKNSTFFKPTSYWHYASHPEGAQQPSGSFIINSDGNDIINLKGYGYAGGTFTVYSQNYNQLSIEYLGAE
ncbi:MAG: hypothetical protein HYZ34_06430 [Ignavibacteriae bacterium]|nr:hypothetical protein [Ignavibacteriota bacterium]